MANSRGLPCGAGTLASAFRGLGRAHPTSDQKYSTVPASRNRRVTVDLFTVGWMCQAAVRVGRGGGRECALTYGRAGNRFQLCTQPCDYRRGKKNARGGQSDRSYFDWTL